MAKYDLSETMEAVNSVPFWWGHIPVGHGIVTPGKKMRFNEADIIACIPSDLKGKTVADVGCWDGQFGFICEERGAVVSFVDKDTRAIGGYDSCSSGYLGIKTALRLRDSKATFIEADVLDFKGNFDLVLGLGLLYHTPNPFTALHRLCSAAKEAVVIETLTFSSPFSSQPLMKFVPSHRGDVTNFWAPNEECLSLMLQQLGFKTMMSRRRGDRLCVYAKRNHEPAWWPEGW